MSNKQSEKDKDGKNPETEDVKKPLEDARALAEERLTHLKYLQADFDNYRKQFEKEKCQIIKLANENLVKELIVLLDDFEASIKSMKESKDKEGLMLLEKKLLKILEKHGVRCIESVGKKFNPHYHEVLCKEDSDKEEDEVLEELQKGYMMDAKVIRASKVKVSKNEKNLNKENIQNNKEK